MKSEGKVRHKLQQVIWRHQSKAVKENFRRAPCRCKHNNRVVSVGGKEVGVCGFTPPEGESWPVVVCDDDMPEGLATARGCPHWEARLSKEQVKENFVLHMQDLLNQARGGEMGPLVAEYPDVGSLVWVLYDGPAPVTEESEEALTEPEVSVDDETDEEEDDDDEEVSEDPDEPPDEVEDAAGDSDMDAEDDQSDSVSAVPPDPGVEEEVTVVLVDVPPLEAKETDHVVVSNMLTMSTNTVGSIDLTSSSALARKPVESWWRVRLRLFLAWLMFWRREPREE